MSNVPTLLGLDPIQWDISDCLKCGAILPESFPFATFPMSEAIINYRLCEDCVAHYVNAGPGETDRWQKDFFARLERITEDMLHNAKAMASDVADRRQ